MILKSFYDENIFAQSKLCGIANLSIVYLTVYNISGKFKVLTLGSKAITKLCF